MIQTRHQMLEEAVREWLQLKNQKADTVKGFNEAIKDVEERIAGISNRLEEDRHQPSLFRENHDTGSSFDVSIMLDESEADHAD